MSVLDFLRWKDEFERQEKCRFVKKSGSRIREEGIRVGYYYCSRSGNYISHSKGVKSIKKIGTSKMNCHCTASITCVELKSGKLEVKACSTHYGHETDLQHLRLTQSQKFMIAEQLCQGVPRELVLDNVRASATSNVDKLHLISLKDVKNIEKSFGIQGVSNVKTDNVYHNLIFWVSNIMKTEHCPLVYFSEDGDFESLNHKDHDLTLVLITKGQIELLNKFGTKGVYYIAPFVAENTHFSYNPHNPVKPYSVYITVVLLVDDLNDVVPVSYMVSHKIHSSKFINLFDSIKDKAPNISAKAILTDDREEIYDAWCAVFGDHPVHLWSNRFVDSDWRMNLIQIPDEDLQESMYEEMYSFLESSDVSKLENTLENFVLKMQSDVRTNRFGDYFASKYIGCEDLWAGCYGKAVVGVNAQLNMENVFNQIEEAVQRKNWDRNFLVRTVQHLIKYINEKQCERHNKLQKQVQEIPTHHNLATNIKPDAVVKLTKTQWRVNSVKDPESIFSLVSKQNYECTPDCAMFCLECDVCAHKFRCSCKVYEFDKTMCKHIHAVALQIKPCPRTKSQKSLKKAKLMKLTRELSNKVALWEEKGFTKKRKAIEKQRAFEEKEKLINASKAVSGQGGKKRKSSSPDETIADSHVKKPKLKLEVFDTDVSPEENIVPDNKPVQSLAECSTRNSDRSLSNLTENKTESLAPETKNTFSDDTSMKSSEENLSEPSLASQPTQINSNDPDNNKECPHSTNDASNPASKKFIENMSSESVIGTIPVEMTLRNKCGSRNSQNKPAITSSESTLSKSASTRNTDEVKLASLPNKGKNSNSLNKPDTRIKNPKTCHNKLAKTSSKSIPSSNLSQNLQSPTSSNQIPSTLSRLQPLNSPSQSKPTIKPFEDKLSSKLSKNKSTNKLPENKPMTTLKNKKVTTLSRSKLSRHDLDRKARKKIRDKEPSSLSAESKPLSNPSESSTSSNKIIVNPIENVHVKPVSDHELATTSSGSEPSKDSSEHKTASIISKNEHVKKTSKRSKPVKDPSESDHASKPSESQSVTTKKSGTKPLSNPSKHKILGETSKDKPAITAPKSKPLRDAPEVNPAGTSSRSKALSDNSKNKLTTTMKNQPSIRPSESSLLSKTQENKTYKATSKEKSASDQAESKPGSDPSESNAASTPVRNKPENITLLTSSSVDLLKSSSDNIKTLKKGGRPQNVSSSPFEEKFKKKRKMSQLLPKDEHLSE